MDFWIAYLRLVEILGDVVQIIRRNLLIFRASLLLLSALIYASSIWGMAIVLGAAVFAIPGAWYRFAVNGGVKKPNETVTYLQFCIYFLMLEFIWDGFKSKDAIDD